MDNDNMKRVRNVLLAILIANVLVAVFKITIGSFIKSTSMSADGFHSLSDGASNVVGLIGVWLASKPVDLEHPYGHRKFETLAGLFIGAMLLLVGLNIMSKAVQRFFIPTNLDVNLESIITLIVTLGINIFVSRFEYRQGKKLTSQILIADSLHTKSDIYVSMGVLCTLIGIKFGIPNIIDPMASIIVALFVFHAAFEILRETSGVLVDRVVVDSEKIREIVMEFSDVKNVHQIRSRGSQDDLYIDLHIMTEPSMSVERSHFLIHSIENKMKEVLCENAQVIVHLEPYYRSEEVKETT